LLSAARPRVAAALAVAVIAAVVVASGAGRGAAHADAGCSWPMYGHDPGHSFAAQAGCTSLQPLNATTLAPAWVFSTPEPVTASPTVVDGTVYVGDWAGTFYAVPTVAPGGAVTPTPKWTFKVDDTDGVAFGRIVSTAAVVTVGGRSVVVFGGGATLYVLDAETGAVLGRACLDPRADPALRCRSSEGQVEIESSPAVVVGGDGSSARILVGLDVHNDRNVGRTGLVALDLRALGAGAYELTPAWKLDPEAGVAYTGPDLLTVGAGTGSGCAGVWSSPAVDVARRLVFFGTSSCSIDDVFVGESAWAADLDTGAVAWQYRPPRTSTRLDDDFGASPNLLPGGLVGFGGKDGWYYALHEEAGSGGAAQLAWSSHLGQSGHVVVDFAVGGIIGSPATGTVKGEPAVFATTGLSTPIANPLDDGASLDTTVLGDPLRLLSLTAISAVDGRVLWRSTLPRQSYGAPSFANGVLLVPSTFSFSLVALRADDGLPLAVVPTLGAPSSSPVAVGDDVFLGVGTSESDLEFKAFGGSAFEPLLGQSPLSPLSGIYRFSLLVPGG
jgi:polyvinyl alcohol dehydrogenase (cytochrome)